VIIPKADQAVVNIHKLRDYTLNTQHRVGRHKARLFVALLDMHLEDAEALSSLLLQIVRTHDAERSDQDVHGQRYRIDFMLTWHGHQARVRSVWNIRPNEDFPRLITCYPLKESGS